MRKIKTFLLAISMTLIMTMNAFSAEYGDFLDFKDENGTYWTYSISGEYVKNNWIHTHSDRWFYAGDDTKLYQNKWLHDISGKWYYFGSDCAMLHDTTKPDGYTVGSDGAWVKDGQVVVEITVDNAVKE